MKYLGVCQVCGRSIPLMVSDRVARGVSLCYRDGRPCCSGVCWINAGADRLKGGV